MNGKVDPTIPPPGYATGDYEYEDNSRNVYYQEPDNDTPLPTPLEGPGFVRKYWRPAMAWQYFTVCLFDFIGGPIVSMVFWDRHQEATEYVPWVSLTLQGGGLYHIAMGAIIGVTAWSRGQEKIHKVDGDY